MPHRALLSDVNESELGVTAKVACPVSNFGLTSRDCECALRGAIGSQNLRWYNRDWDEISSYESGSVAFPLTLKHTWAAQAALSALSTTKISSGTCVIRRGGPAELPLL